MPRFFIKLNAGDRDWYLIWSTVVDAPVSLGMSREEAGEHVREQYGRGQLESWWPGALKLLDERGVSSRGYSSHIDAVCANRAGAGESCLSPVEIVEVYCLRQRVARDGRCLLKGRHTHMGPEAVEHCRWDEDPPRQLVRGEFTDLKNRQKER